MPTRILTNAEIKVLTGNGSASDVLVEMWNDAATELVCALLEVTDIAKHQVVDERVKVLSAYELIFEQFPVDTDQTITLKTLFDGTAITGYTFRKDPQRLRTVRLYNVAGNVPYPLNYDGIFATYTAGWNVQDTLTVLSLTGLADKTITVTIAGVATTWTIKASGATGNQINVGLTTDATATAIAAALGGAAVGSVVTLPLGSKVLLGTATSAQLTIVNADVPVALKNCVALIAGGGIAEKSKAGGVVSYTIGGKTLSFRNDKEANAVQTLINTWIATYKKVKIFAV